MMFFSLLLIASNASAQTPLTMTEYLNQVRSNYLGYKGATENREAAKDKASQADLLTSLPPRLWSWRFLPPWDL